MAATSNVVNLDALIPRDDFAIDAGPTSASRLDKIDIHHLDDHFFVGALRKPDFQRETAHWTPQKVLELVLAFIDGDLIPAVILWQRGRDVFVIDGAHRLSALIAWVKDDYGDGRTSLEYFGGKISDEQGKVADRTRKLINSEIGPYGEYAAGRKNPSILSEKKQARLSNLATNSIIAQWVPAVEPKAAEDSFFKINQAATPIDPTERRILKARKSANALAARAIVRAGTGHKYWSSFSPDVQSEIENLGRALYASLYEPPLGDKPIKTLDIPVAGRGYNALPFVFDLVNLANGANIPDSTSKKRFDDLLPDDSDGTQTLEFLKRTNRLIEKITGTRPASLGVHPVAYFYTRAGVFQPVAFLATAALLQSLSETGGLKGFTAVRKSFEDFLIGNKEFISHTLHRFGSGERSLVWIVKYFEYVIERFKENKTPDQIREALFSDAAFQYLASARPPRREVGTGKRRTFNDNTKSATFIASAIQSAVSCGLCGALVHKNSMNFDHIVTASTGGENSAGNARVTHPYCNSIRN